jgi:hypothetical protein
MKHVGKEPFPPLYVDPKPDSEAAKAGAKYEPIAKAQLKKMTKLWQQEVRDYTYNYKPTVLDLLYFLRLKSPAKSKLFFH